MSRSLRTWLLTVVVLVGVGVASSPRWRLPDGLPAAAPDAAFSAARAMAQLVEVAQQPHPPGSPDHDRVRDHLEQRLRALGLEPEVQTATSVVVDSTIVRAATVRNVLARIAGTGSTGAVAVLAHYDAAPLSPGAADNGVGVAVALEVVRAVRGGGPLRNDVIVVFTDADEVGLLGTRALADHPWTADVRAALVVDARGASGPAVVFAPAAAGQALLDALAAPGTRPAPTSMARPLFTPPLDSVALAPLVERGVLGIAITPLGGGARRHQTGDVPETVSERTLQHTGAQLLALVRGLGDRDLTEPGATAGAARVHFDLPFVGPVHYASSLTRWVTLALLVVFAGIALAIRARRGSAKDALIGLSAALASVGLSVWIGRLAFDFVRARHPEYGALHTALYRDGPHVLALAAVAIALISVLWAVVRRFARADTAMVGAFAVPALGVAWMTFRAPQLTPFVQWPTAIAVLGLLGLVLAGPARLERGWASLLQVAVACAILVAVVPSLELMATAHTLRAAPVLAATCALAALLLLPIWDLLLRQSVWWTPVLALSVAATATVVSSPFLLSGARHPLPSALVFFTEAPVPSRLPVAARAAAEVDSAGPRIMAGHWLTLPGPGESWARSWVAEPPIGSTDPGVVMLPDGWPWELAGAGPDARLVAPRIGVLDQAFVDGRQRVRLAVVSGLRGEMVGVHVPDGVDAHLIGVGEATVPGASRARSLAHWGRAEGDAVVVVIDAPADATALDLVVVEHHLRPEEVLGDYFSERPDSIVPNALAGSDRVIQRTALRVPLAAPPGAAGAAPSGP